MKHFSIFDGWQFVWISTFLFIFTDQTAITLYPSKFVLTKFSCYLLFFFFFSESLDELAGKRVLLFSYGSGLASAMFSFRISDDFGPSSPLNTLVTSLKDIPARLASRKEVEPAEFLETLKIREHTHNNSSYTPIGSEEDLFPGTYYLTYVDDKFRRTYQRKKNSSNEGSCMVV